MNINYNRLFNLNVGHDYFVDGYDKYVQLFPTYETDKLLRNGKMLFKHLPHGVTVLYNATDDEITPFVELNSKQSFVFVLKTENPGGLLNITNLDESVSRQYSSNNILYFKNDPAAASSNSNNPEVITHELLDTLRSQLFTYNFSVSGNPSDVLLQVKDAGGTLVSVGRNPDGSPFPTSLPLSINTNNTFSQQIDLRDKPKGRYTICILNSGGTATLMEEDIYADELLASQNILGIVEIVYETASGHLYSDTEEYRLQFHRAELLWKYYAINKSKNVDFDTDEVVIVDTGTSNGTPYIINQFERVYSCIEITADTVGTAGNLIELEYSGSGDYPAVKLSGKTLAGGASGKAATGTITIIDNTISGYTVSINGIDFEEGLEFNNGATAADTAQNLTVAINLHATVNVSTLVLGYDMTINDIPVQVLKSTLPIPFFEKPKTGIQLHKKSDDQKVVPNLPNPSHNGIRKFFAGVPESEVYVFI